MQPITNLEITAIALPSILLGFILGYFIGAMKGLRIGGRLVLSLIASTTSGVIFSFLLTLLIPLSTYTILLSTISVFGGVILGLIYNWSPPDQPVRSSHIIFEPDDDEFEKEIRESMGGKQ